MKADGSNASGLPFVPFDGYKAVLHRGETVLNSTDAEEWRAYKAGNIVGYTSPQQDVVINLTAELDGDVLARKQLLYNARQRQLSGTSMIDGEVY